MEHSVAPHRVTLSPGRPTRAILAVCSALFLLLIAWILIWPYTGDGDSIFHYLIARQTLRIPGSALTAFARPLHKLLIVLPAQLGVAPARIFSALISTLAAWQTIRLADDLKLPNTLLAAPLLILQPIAFALAGDTMTEMPMVLFLVIAIRLWQHGRRIESSLIIAFMPLARPEGFFLIAMWGMLWLITPSLGRIWRRMLSASTLIVGMLVWSLLCRIFLHDWFFVVRYWNWPIGGGSNAVHGAIWHYVVRWPLFCGPLMLLLFIAGIRSSIARAMALPWAVCLLFFLLHTYIFWRGTFGSVGLLRMLAPTAPITAIICLFGLNAIGGWLSARGFTPRSLCAAAAISLTIACLWAMGYYASNPDRWRCFSVRRAAAFMRQRNLVHPARPFFTSDRMIIPELNLPIETNIPKEKWSHDAQIETLLALPAGTVGLWDNQQGLYWHCVSIDELQRDGFEILYETHLTSPNLNAHFAKGEPWLIHQRFVVLRKQR